MSNFLYYLKNYASYFLPDRFFRERVMERLSALNPEKRDTLLSRVNYYNKLTDIRLPGPGATPLSHFRLRNHNSTYFFDSYKYVRKFESKLKFDVEFGDVTKVPESPKIVKSRPVHANNNNAVLMKLNKLRHFVFVNDKQELAEKKDQLVWRGGCFQPHRINFLKMYFGHPLCNIGQTNSDINPQWQQKRLPINKQLEYKFILCLEGNDVASNLKWVMSSNSLAVMPAPKFETWFMEGTLQAGLHYVPIRDDYTDLEEKMQYYINHKDEAAQIIANAKEHVTQFKNEPDEDLISLLVLQKYFERTGQFAT